MDAEVKKIMARTLRYYAHTNGAALLYMGGMVRAHLLSGTQKLIRLAIARMPFELIRTT